MAWHCQNARDAESRQLWRHQQLVSLRRHYPRQVLGRSPRLPLSPFELPFGCVFIMAAPADKRIDESGAVRRTENCCAVGGYAMPVHPYAMMEAWQLTMTCGAHATARRLRLFCIPVMAMRCCVGMNSSARMGFRGCGPPTPANRCSCRGASRLRATTCGRPSIFRIGSGMISLSGQPTTPMWSGRNATVRAH